VPAPPRQRFVEGFQAADIDKVSERWLANAASPEGEEYNRAGRLVTGYGRLIEFLSARLGSRIQLTTRVERIRWRPAGSVWTPSPVPVARADSPRAP